MRSRPHSGIEGAVTEGSYFDLDEWQKIQSRFAELIGANLYFILPTQLLSFISAGRNPACSDLVYPQESHAFGKFNCIRDAFLCASKQGEIVVSCVHKLQYGAAPVRLKSNNAGTVLIGPAVVGGRKALPQYEIMCEELGIQKVPFLDRVRELHVFSFKGMYTVLECVREIAEYVARTSTRSIALN